MSDKQQTALRNVINKFDEIKDLDPSVQILILRGECEANLELEKQQHRFMFECGRNFQMTAEGTFNEIYNETFKTESNGK